MSVDLAPEALLFDCDGVLVDSDDSVVACWTRWAQHYDLDADTVLGLVHGRPSRESVRLLLPERLHVDAAALIQRFEVDDADGVRALPGAADLLDDLGDTPWAIVTSAVGPLAIARLTAAGLPIPQALVTADLVEHGKPAPDGYLAGARRLQAEPGRCLVFEDTENGVRAARAAGVLGVIGVSARSIESDADLVVADLAGVRWRGGRLVLAPDRILRPAGAPPG